MVFNNQTFNNLERDISDTGEAVNECKMITPRYGLRFKSIPLISKEADVKVSELSSAIDTALAAGAGEAGWTANLIAYGDITQKEFNDGTNQKTGWIVTVEMFGGEQGLDNSDAFQRAYDFLHTVGGGKLTSSIRKHYITKAVKYYDDIETDLCGAQVICQGAGKFVSALYNADKTASISPYGAEVYYKNAQSITAQNPISALTLDAKKGASSIVVNDASLFKVGDYVFVNNGYCDMWRVMEDYTGSKQDWNQTDVDLWRCEISKIKSIVANTIYFEDQIANDYLVKVKTYGLFADENNRADHVGWNYARIERLGGVYDSKFKNIKFINEGATISLLAFLSVNFNTLNCTFEGTGRGVEYVSCYNSHILGNFSDTTSYGQSIRRGSSMCIMGNATANYVAGDCPLIIWEGSNLCVAKGIGIEGKGGITGHAKIGFYFNSCWNCVGSDFVGKNLKDVASALFCREGIVISNVIGTNCDTLFACYASTDVTAQNGSLTGYATQTRTEYTDCLFRISESSDVTVSNLRDTKKYKATEMSGRAHMFKSFDVSVSDIKAENVRLWSSVDDDKIYLPDRAKLKVKNSKFKDLRLTQTLADATNQTRLTDITNSEIMQQVRLDYINNVVFDKVKILGKDVNSSLRLTISHFTQLLNCYIKNNSIGIDFLGGGASGNQNQTSLVYLENTTVDAPTKFANYVDPSYMLQSGTGISSRSITTGKISVLTEFPKKKTYENPGRAGHVGAWVLTEATSGNIVATITSAELQSASNAMNTAKYLGKEVYNSTINKFMKSLGSTPTSSWLSLDGMQTITPT